MKQENEIVALVYAAKGDNQAAERLVNQYIPFIKSETAKYIKRNPVEGRDDELSIAMFAFHEAVLAYEKSKGAFLNFASRVIRNRLIDYTRKEQRHVAVISFDAASSESDNRTLLETLDTGTDEIHECLERSAVKEELLHFSEELAVYGLCLTDIADNCPRQERTLLACHRALAYAKRTPELIEAFVKNKKLPLNKLAEGAKVRKKTLERHRKYMVAILLAYTNGFEIIRGHLKQVASMKGGQPV